MGTSQTGPPLSFAKEVFMKVREMHGPGDHALVVGEVVHAGLGGKGTPLMCADLKWHYGG
jgi:hypothetical protein